MNFKIKIKPYNMVVECLYGTYTHYKQDIMHLYGDDEPGPSAYAIVRADELNNIFLWINSESKLSQSTIAHEAVHISWIINKMCGLDHKGFRYSTQEVQAYMVGEIVEKINKKLKHI